MNSTEQKIRDAFDEYRSADTSLPYYYEDFEAGYLSLLNELELSGSIICGDKFARHGVKYDLYEGVFDEGGYWDARGYELIPIYRLPEGIEK